MKKSSVSAKKSAKVTHPSTLDPETIERLERCATIVDSARQQELTAIFSIGDALREAQSILANHGNGAFGQWLESRCNMSRRTAYNYIQIAKKVQLHDRATVSQSFDAGALYELTAAKAAAGTLSAAVQAANTGQYINRAIARKMVQQRAIAERAQAVIELPTTCRIECRDLRDWSNLPPESVDLVLVDLMYDEGSLWQYSEIAKLAAHCLRRNGWCLAYAGKMFINKVHCRMSEYLDYGWTWDVLYERATLIESLQIEQGAKYVVGYRHEPSEAWWHPLTDRLEYRPEKFAGRWQQPVREVTYLVRSLCPAGGVVFDAAVGTGTTALASIGSGMQFIGGDADEEMVAIAKARIAEHLAEEAVA
jgi:hypothetical protein